MLAAFCPLLAQAGIRQERLQFPYGKLSLTLKGTLHGEESVEYTLRAEAVKPYEADRQAGGGANFDVTASGDDPALFMGRRAEGSVRGSCPGRATMSSASIKRGMRLAEGRRLSIRTRFASSETAAPAALPGRLRIGLQTPNRRNSDEVVGQGD